MFRIEDCKIRLAEERDRPDLVEIASKTWGGHDYLPEILDRWINEDWFFVCTYLGKVISCIKLSRFPNNVLWIEGLRVHPRYRGKSVAGLMNRALFDFARKLGRENPKLAFECCIYFANVQSSHLTCRYGFQKVDGFFNLERRGVIKTQKPEEITDFGMEIFEHYSSHLALNWHAVQNTEESLAFIREHARLYRSPNLFFLIGNSGDLNLTLLCPPTAPLREDLPYLQYFFGPRKNICVVMGRGMTQYLQIMEQNNFRFWDDLQKGHQNMLVLRRPIA